MNTTKKTMTWDQYRKADVLHKLHFWRTLKPGTYLPGLGFPSDTLWIMGEACGQAIEEIIFQRGEVLSLQAKVANHPSEEFDCRRK